MADGDARSGEDRRSTHLLRIHFNQVFDVHGYLDSLSAGIVAPKKGSGEGPEREDQIHNNKQSRKFSKRFERFKRAGAITYGNIGSRSVFTSCGGATIGEHSTKDENRIVTVRELLRTNPDRTWTASKHSHTFPLRSLTNLPS